MSNHYIITDFGKNYTVVSESGEEIIIPRYGVWRVANGVMVEVVETSLDWKEMAEKYGISEDDIHLIDKEEM